MTVPAFSQEAQQKRAFAEQLAQGFSPMVACKRIWGDMIENGHAYGLGELWKDDPHVRACLEELRQSKAKEDKAPAKDELIKQLRDRMTTMEDEQYLKGVRLVAELCSYIEKPQAAVTVNTGTVNERVMIVRDHGTDDDWEAKAAAQQAKLIEHV